MRQLFGVIAQYEKSTIVLKLRAARQRMRVKQGKCEGAKLYGEREGEMEVVEKIKQLHAIGKNYSQIAAELNATGVKTRIGRLWYPAGVSAVLSHANQ